MVNTDLIEKATNRTITQYGTYDEAKRFFLDAYQHIVASKYPRINDALSLLIKHVPANSEVVEIGCGLGYISYYLSKHCSYRVTGYELSEQVTEAANGIIKEIVPGYADTLHIVSGAFEILRNHGKHVDAAVAFEVIEHVDNPTEFLKCVHAILKPGGILILTTPNAGGLKNFIPKNIKGIIRFVESLPPYSGGEQDHISLWDFQTLYRLCHRAGFRLVDYRFTDFLITFPVIRRLFYLPWFRSWPILRQYSNNLIFALQKV